MSTWIINSDNSIQSFIGDIRAEYLKHRYVKISSKAGKDRSLDQNAISHAWYEQLGRELRENDSLGWKAYCKLHFGVPILRQEDAEFKIFYDASLLKLSYEQKIDAMKFVPVTSIMLKPQLSKYLELMQEYFSKLGVFLEFPQ
jgi:hypothetical protein